MNDNNKNPWEKFWRDNYRQNQRISHSKKRIIGVVEKYVGNFQTALDAGCGSGFFSQYFVSRGLKTYAVDSSEQALKLTSHKTQGKAVTISANFVSDPMDKFLKEPVGIIFSDGLFEHFTSNYQDLIMKNFISILQPGGIIITFVPNRWSPWELIRPFLMPGIGEKPFTFQGLINLNNRNGLAVLETGGINTIPVPWSPDKIFGKQFGMLLYTISKKSA